MGDDPRLAAARELLDISKKSKATKDRIAALAALLEHTAPHEWENAPPVGFVQDEGEQK